MQPAGQPTVLFDGKCGFCARSIRFLLAHQKPGALRLVPSQSDAAQQLLAELGITQRPASIVLVEDGQLRVRSDALLRISRYMRWPWNLLAYAAVIPAPLRDSVYDWIAANRYRWSKSSDVCAIN